MVLRVPWDDSTTYNVKHSVAVGVCHVILGSYCFLIGWLAIPISASYHFTGYGMWCIAVSAFLLIRFEMYIFTTCGILYPTGRKRYISKRKNHINIYIHTVGNIYVEIQQIMNKITRTTCLNCFRGRNVYACVLIDRDVCISKSQ